MRETRLRAIVHADVDPSLIDGSAVWLVSTVELLARAGCDVTLLLRDRRHGDLPLLRPLLDLPSVRIAEPSAEAERRDTTLVRRRDSVIAHLRRLDAEARADLIVVRGLRVATRLAQDKRLQGRLWVYLTDIPQSVVDLDDEAITHLGAIARASRVVLCQTEELRSYLESVVPATVGRTEILPPVVPTVAVGGAGATPPASDDVDRPIRLVYSGKFAPLWNTLEMTRLPARLADVGIPAELFAIGDKIHTDRADPTYRDRMQAALEKTPGVTWLGGQSREEAMRLTATADIALGWRDPSMDASLELSTKVLEYGMLGLPVVLDRTPMHERLLGRDYPLFVSNEDDVVAAIAGVAADPAIGALATERLRVASADHTFERGTERLQAILARAFPPPLRQVAGRPIRIVVAGHDLKFFAAIQAQLGARPDVEIRTDQWSRINVHDPGRSEALIGWADLIICEWFGQNAVWYSTNLRPEQRLIVRLHRVELESAWPAEAAIDRIDRVVCVSQSYASLTRNLTGWPASKITVIPNGVDVVSLDRPKFEGSRFHLGFIGMAPARKRLDRALDVLEALRAGDERYRLFVKTKPTWDYRWLWQRPEERAHVDRVMRRIQRSRLLADSVVFDDFGPDVASWLRRIGFVLSTSDDESFHLAPAEGMASGAVPAIMDWPGSDTIYDPHWIHRTTDGMARSISSVVADGRWDEERGLARAQARAAFSLASVSDAWARLIVDVVGERAADGTASR